MNLKCNVTYVECPNRARKGYDVCSDHLGAVHLAQPDYTEAELMELKQKLECPTCQDAREIDYDLGKPAWPNLPGSGAPNQVIRVTCPDCVPCVQCAHPNYDGVHSCRKFQPT